MWHGGTNLAREEMYLSSATYDFDAPIDEFGLPTTKSERLRPLHEFVRRYSSFLFKGRKAGPRILAKDDSSDLAEGVVLNTFTCGGKQLLLVVNGGWWTKSVKVGGTMAEIPGKCAAVFLREGRRCKPAIVWMPTKRVKICA